MVYRERCGGLNCDLEYVRALVILGVSKPLGVELPVDVVGVGEKPAS